jgi:RHS repeat-associated protein
MDQSSNTVGSAFYNGLKAMVMCILFWGPVAKAQEFQFAPDVFHDIFYSYSIGNGAYTSLAYNNTLFTIADDHWTDMSVTNPTTWSSNYKFKSISDIIRVGINHDTALIVTSNYKYRVFLDIHAYSDPSSPSTYTDIPLSLVLEYNKDSLITYGDQDVMKLGGQYHQMDVILTGISDISSNPLNTTSIPINTLPKNFFIEVSVATQRYDIASYNLFSTAGYNATTEGLAVNFGFYPAGTSLPTCGGIFPQFADYKPVKYELEWTYVDDYKNNNYNFTSGSSGYKNTATTFAVSYNFRTNATRIQTYDHAFEIPAIYEHGTIVYRVRTVRPDPNNYSQLIYSNWSLADTGTIINTQFNTSNAFPFRCPDECLYINTTPFGADKFNWQYSINFAEQGKYKHVLNFFDGAGHNRQTQTKINTDQQYVIAADHIYDYEGHAAIQTLPIPVLDQKLDYKPTLSLKAGTDTAYRAADFDFGCSTDSISGFDAASLAAKYYSPANTDKAGMQAYVPSAEGYPFSETMYSPDNTTGPVWQGGAGYNFQRFKKHGITSAYIRADQYDLDQLLGTQAGRNEYYPKVITKDQNQQLSYSIYNQKGKIVASALVGINPDNATTNPVPIVALDNIAAPTSVATDILANLTQSIGNGLRSANYAFFPEASGNNALHYHGKIPPYYTGCGSQYLNIAGYYSLKVVNECGDSLYKDAGFAGATGTITSNTSQSFTNILTSAFSLSADKYTIVKQLYFPDTTITRMASDFTVANSGIGMCYDYQDDFIRKTVDSAVVPCVATPVEDHCTLMKDQMKSELWPGAKYGSYTKTSSGSFASGGTNSIFSLIDATGQPPLPTSDSFMYIKQGFFQPPEGGVLQCNDAPPNYGNPDSFISIGTIDTIYTNSSTPPASVTLCDWHYDFIGPIGLPSGAVKMRYQYSCALLPYVPDGIDPVNHLQIVGHANFVPPDTLIKDFSDAMAEALLPYHPEYCKLLLCDDASEDILKTITSYQDAQALGLYDLSHIIAADPLSTTPFASQLSHFQIGNATSTYGSSWVNMREQLDTLSLEQAYCGCDGMEAYMYCKDDEYVSQIHNMTMADTTIQNAFIRKLIANYISNRDMIRQKLMDGQDGSCAPCPALRMTLTGTPVFPVVFDPTGSTLLADSGVTSSQLNLMQQGINGYQFSATTLPTDVSTLINNNNTNVIAQQDTAIMNQLLNCVFTPSSTRNTIAAALANTAIVGADGMQLTPHKVDSILRSVSVPINELCNAFLVDYGIYNPKKTQVNPNYADKSPEFYTGFQAFLNRSEIRTSLTASSSTVTSLTLSPNSNKFESDLATYLGGNSVSATTYPKSVSDAGYTQSYLDLVISYGTSPVVRDTIFLSKRTSLTAPPPDCIASVSYPVTVTGETPSNLSFTSVHSSIDDPAVINLSDGLLADNIIFAQLHGYADYVTGGTNNHVASCDNYIIWSHDISMLKKRDPEALDGCLTCVSMKNAAQAYFSDASTYGMPIYTNDPYFEDDFSNYLNYTLGKDHTYFDYENLMKGCALSNQIAFNKNFGQYQVTLTTPAAVTSLINGLNTSVGDINISFLTFNDAASSYQVWFDLNSVPKSKYLAVKNYLASYSPVSNYFYPGTFASVLVPSGGCAPTWSAVAPTGMTITAPSSAVSMRAPDGTYSASYTLYKLSASGATEQNIADAISNINAYFSSTTSACARGIILPARDLMRSADYATTAKQAYLSYVYGLGTAGQSQSDIANNIAPSVLQSSVSPFTGYDLVSYKSPWCANVKTNLYYGSSPSATTGWTRLSAIISQVTGTLGSSKLFPTSNFVNITPGSLGNELKAITMSSGNLWYRLFDGSNKLYNVYIVPSDKMINAPSNYTMVSGSLKPIAGPDSIFNFKVDMQQVLSGGTHYVTCYGYTDFSLGADNTLQNVVLFDNDQTPGCLDTLPCERQTELNAIAQGKMRYGAYIDSIKQYHYLAMRDFFPASTVDTLDFTTMKQQYQYTVYYYDQAGLLVKTIPPDGVTPVGDISHVDAARNTGDLSLTTFNVPQHSKVSEYHYNSSNQPIWQKTPDAGITQFFYDNAGRLAFSQNAKQADAQKYSYTLYDAQGRIIESGAMAFDPTTYATPNPPIVQNSESESFSTIASFVKTKPREDVVATFYDEQLLTLASNPGMSAQDNLRKRIASILYKPMLAGNDTTTIESYYAYGTHFSYDALGNIKTLVQDNPYMDYLGQRFKRIDYDYDLLSSKINMVSYNRGKPDQFYQKYSYDADNRITTVQSSNDGLIWDRDASYEYYKHGPLAKVSFGDQTVQSMQYAYTIQGWLKAINGDVIDSTVDMGKDGLGGGMFPADVMAHALDYYSGDYKPIGGTSPVKTDTTPLAITKSLYNGNIARQTTGVAGLDNLQRTYTYDQLNRIKSASYAQVNNLTHAIVTMATNAFASNYTYDNDGNIKSLNRYNGTGVAIDQFVYNYPLGFYNNQLGSVTDNAAATGGNDLQPGQAANNYGYNKIGELVHDSTGHIDSIYWNLYGKITDMNMHGTNTHIHFDYDGQGNRVRKDVFSVTTGGDTIRTSDVYVRDASGNILAVYKGKSKLTDGYTIEWINDDINHYHGAYITPTNTGLVPFLVHQFGLNGQFVSPVIHSGETLNPEWSNEQSASLSLTQYLNLSDGIFSQATHEPISDYWGPMVGANSSILVTTLNAEGNINFIPLLTGLVSDSKASLPTLVHLTTDAPDLSQAIMNDLRLSYTGDVTNDANAIASTFRGGISPFISSFATNANSYPVTDFYTNLIKDGSIITSDWLRTNTGIASGLSDAITVDAPRGDASDFFAGYLNDTQPDWLTNKTSLDDRLNVVYQSDQPTFLNSYINNVGMTALNQSLHAIPQLTTAGYAHAVWVGVLHGTLNPGYTPPDVNTPQPDSGQVSADTIYLAEHHLYGSSRFGIKTYDSSQYRAVYIGVTPMHIADSSLNLSIPWLDGGFVDWIQKDKTTTYTSSTFNLSLDTFSYLRRLGSKEYELTDHLGNVLATVLDKKTGYGSVGGLYQGYYANLTNVTDYYPFGMAMPGRNKTFVSFRFGYNDKENDNEVYGFGNFQDYGMRMYTPQIARFLSVDPLTAKYPWYTPYQFAGNKPTRYVDLDGMEEGDLLPPGETPENEFKDPGELEVERGLSPQKPGETEKPSEEAIEKFKESMKPQSGIRNFFTPPSNEEIMQRLKNALVGPGDEMDVDENAGSTPPKKDRLSALRMGNKVHYDEMNGGTGQELPTAIARRYPLTQFRFARRGQKGADVEYIGGLHPSAYEGSSWEPGNDFGDFKPATPNGIKTFNKEVKSGKLPQNTQRLLYDPITGDLL